MQFDRRQPGLIDAGDGSQPTLISGPAPFASMARLYGYEVHERFAVGRDQVVRHERARATKKFWIPTTLGRTLDGALAGQMLGA